jgi:hypothetical protein
MQHAYQQGATRRTVLRAGAAAGTAATLGAAGRVSRLTAIYDSSLLSYAAYQSLAGLAAEATLS